jgi:asparagine synthetase B (glutamine-hydrolysing)
MHLADEARDWVKVLLSGEGADELFGGYRRYMRFLKKRPSVAGLIESNQFNSVALVNSIVRHPNGNLPPERLASAESLSEGTPARQLTLYDLRFYLPGLLLRQDKMGMAANLEVRVPYLDKRLVETALALFVWSAQRILPVRVTELSIVEEAFDPALNPIRAKVSLGMRVLSVDDVGFAHRGGSLFMAYLRAKEQLVAKAPAATLSNLGISGIP